jgi:hypothetical protein
MNILAVTFVYAGALVLLAALIARRFRVTAAAAAALLLGFLLPTGEWRVAAVQTRLDEFVPAWQFDEVHSVRIRASRDCVYSAIRTVTPGEISLFQTLTWIRRFGKRGPQSIINAPAQEPLLDTALRTGFQLLAEDPGQEIVFGVIMARPSSIGGRGKRTPEQFKALSAAHAAKVAMNFRVEEENSDFCTLTTETRVYATDPASRRAFAAYWRVIYPGSACIRRMWLQAIKRRAERAVPNSVLATARRR